MAMMSLADRTDASRCSDTVYSNLYDTGICRSIKSCLSIELSQQSSQQWYHASRRLACLTAALHWNTVCQRSIYRRRHHYCPCKTPCPARAPRSCLLRVGQDAGTVVPPEAACIAVAGPVSQNRVVMTNRNWVIDGSEVSLD